MAIRIRKDDIVEVIAGEGKGERGKVLKVMPKDKKVLIQGVNMVYRHVRPSRKNPQGGRLQKEAPIHLSNVLPIDDKAGRGKRVRFELEMGADGQRKAKYRVTVAGTRLNEVTQEKAEG